MFFCLVCVVIGKETFRFEWGDCEGNAGFAEFKRYGRFNLLDYSWTYCGWWCFGIWEFEGTEWSEDGIGIVITFAGT